MTDSERRFTPGQVEVRRASEKRTIGGYAAKFNALSQNLGGFQEVIAPTAFNRSKGNDWPGVMARYNHDDMMLLGTTNARTLRLTLDEIGLIYETDLPSSRADVFELVERGDIAKSSFAFRVIGEDGEEWGLNETNFPTRTLRSVELVDVAPVNVPAYLDTSTAVRSLARKVHGDEAEIRKMSDAGDLSRLFLRKSSDSAGAPGQRRTFGPSARMALLARKSDPYAGKS
jgi:HK97 family phage prohead protease